MVRVVFSEFAEAGLAQFMSDENRRNGLRESLKFYLKRDLIPRRQILITENRFIWASPYWNDMRIVWERDENLIRVWHIGKLSVLDDDRL
jgi:hypothetical protein